MLEMVGTSYWLPTTGGLNVRWIPTGCGLSIIMLAWRTRFYPWCWGSIEEPRLLLLRSTASLLLTWVKAWLLSGLNR